MAAPRVAVVGRRYGAPHRRTCYSVRSALSIARDADEDGTWSVEAIEVDGTVVMVQKEITERLTRGNFDDLPEPAGPGPDSLLDGGTPRAAAEYIPSWDGHPRDEPADGDG